MTSWILAMILVGGVTNKPQELICVEPVDYIRQPPSYEGYPHQYLCESFPPKP